MSLENETTRLRRRFRKLVRAAHRDRLRERYGLVFHPPKDLSFYRRARIAIGRLRRRLGLKRYVDPEPWPVALKHAPGTDRARPLVIWALGVDRETVLRACKGFQRLQVEAHDFAPVLVTDVADFAFYSRLGWLVEYVPALSEPATSYQRRKLRHLAWRYRDALVLPVSAGLDDNVTSVKTLLLRGTLRERTV